MKRFTFILLFTLLVGGVVFSLYALYDKAGRVEPTEYTQNESQAPRFEIHGTNINSVRVLTDNQTGVQYALIRDSGITPLLNSDGSLLLDGEVGGPLP